MLTVLCQKNNENIIWFRISIQYSKKKFKVIVMETFQKLQWNFKPFVKNFSTWYIVKSDLKQFEQVAPIIFRFMQQ